MGARVLINGTRYSARGRGLNAQSESFLESLEWRCAVGLTRNGPKLLYGTSSSPWLDAWWRDALHVRLVARRLRIVRPGLLQACVHHVTDVPGLRWRRVNLHHSLARALKLARRLICKVLLLEVLFDHFAVDDLGNLRTALVEDVDRERGLLLQLGGRFLDGDGRELRRLIGREPLGKPRRRLREFEELLRITRRLLRACLGIDAHALVVVARQGVVQLRERIRTKHARFQNVLREQLAVRCVQELARRFVESPFAQTLRFLFERLFCAPETSLLVPFLPVTIRRRDIGNRTGR